MKKDTWPIRISAVLPHNDQGYWTILGEGCETAAKESGCDIKHVWPRVNYDTGQLIRLLWQEIAAQTDIIICQGIDDPNYEEALTFALNQGIQVVLVDADMEALPEHLYVGTDNYEAGKMMGEALLEIVGDHAVIAVMTGKESGYHNLDERMSGFMDVVALHPDILLCDTYYNNFISLTATDCYRSLTLEHPDAEALVCLEGTGGDGIGKYIHEDEKTIPYILCFDMAEGTKIGMQNGVIDATLMQEEWEMGFRAVEQAVCFLENGAYDASEIYTGTYLLKADNSKEFSNENK